MALSYGFPARKLVVIGVTGTKGKSTTAEMLFSILRTAGHKTALISTIRFAIEDDSEPKRYKMTLQGRGFAQAFMRRALKPMHASRYRSNLRERLTIPPLVPRA